MRPIVGIPACSKLIANHRQHATPARYGEALILAAGAVPVLIPAEGEIMLALLDRLDGILFDGSPSNVEPSRYGAAVDETPGAHDPDRDATTLPLIRAAIARGLPILGICRGVQEINVALGGTLSQKAYELPGRMDHRAGNGTLAEQFAVKHAVYLSGEIAQICGGTSIDVNSLHGQAIGELAPGLVVEAMAPDDTIEGIRVKDAKGFAIGVQWHPEWEVLAFPDRRRLFESFGQACRRYYASERQAA